MNLQIISVQLSKHICFCLQGRSFGSLCFIIKSFFKVNPEINVCGMNVASRFCFVKVTVNLWRKNISKSINCVGGVN